MLKRLSNLSLVSGILGKSMISGAAWTTGSFAYRYGLRLLSTVIVTRLLMPEAYGLMSLAMIFVTGLVLFSDIGITPAVIQNKRGEDPDFLRTAWTIKVLRGLVLGVLGCAIAWPAATAYNEPQLVGLICALSLVPVLDGLMSISQLVYERRIQLKVLNLIEMASSTMATGLTIFFAWQLQSVWALVIGTLGGASLRMVCTYIFLDPFQHKFRLNKRDAFEILTFGGWILLSTMVSFIGGRGLILIQGALVSIAVLGFITLADTLAWAMGELVGLVMGKVLFPALTAIARERPDELRGKVYKTMTLVYYGLMPFFILLALVAHPLIDILYDDRYAVVGDFLVIMSLISGLSVMLNPYTNVILAMGDGRTHFILVGAGAVFRIVPMIAGFYLAGPFGMMIGIALGVMIYNIFAIHVAERHKVGNLKRDYLAQAVMVVILGIAAYAVLNGAGYEALQAAV